MWVGKLLAPVAVAFVIAPASFQSAFAGATPTGIWMNDTGRGAVEIKSCGNALCGNVVWVKSSADASGCGKPVIGDVKSVGDGRWDNGWIYSPERGRKYDVELTPLSNGNLKVVGYAGMKFLSKTMIWKPAPVDLQLCGQTEAKTETPRARKPDITTAAITPPAPPPATTQAKAADKAPASAADTQKADDKSKQANAPAASTDDGKSATADGDAKNDSASNDDDGKGDIADTLGKLKIGDMSLDKVLTKTKSGKCKLDLPWFKVTLDCPQE